MLKRLTMVALLGAFSLSAMAQYRCVENGKTTFTERPCADSPKAPDAGKPGSGPKVLGDSANSAYGTPNGSWRGQVQYQATGSMGVIGEAMAVVSMTLDIDPQGKVIGSSSENGCKAKGIASPATSPLSLSLDVTLVGCHYSGLNRRYFGSLNVDQQKKQAQFSLQGVYRVFADSFHTEVRGTLRR